MRIKEESQLKAVIFDMDGVIIDTCQLHMKAWKIAGNFCGYPWPEGIDFKKDIFGTVSLDSAKLLFGDGPSNNPILLERKDMEYERLLQEKILDIVVPGVVDFMRLLKNSGLKLAIATSSRSEEANFVIDSIKIRDLLDAVVDISQVVHAKPKPDIYLKALSKLNLTSAECIAFEDSISGYEAVIGAGVRCIVVKTTMDDEKIAKNNLRCEALINNFLPDELRKLSLAIDFVPTFI